MRRLASLPLALALAIALFASSWAAPGTVNVVSDAGTRLLYVGLVDASDPAAPASGLPSGWNSDPNFDDGAWAPAANSGNFLWLPPSTTPPFAGTGARWISYTASGLCPDYWESSGRRGVYLFRKTFELPSGASRFSSVPWAFCSTNRLDDFW